MTKPILDDLAISVLEAFQQHPGRNVPEHRRALDLSSKEFRSRRALLGERGLIRYDSKSHRRLVTKLGRTFLRALQTKWSYISFQDRLLTFLGTVNENKWSVGSELTLQVEWLLRAGQPFRETHHVTLDLAHTSCAVQELDDGSVRIHYLGALIITLGVSGSDLARNICPYVPSSLPAPAGPARAATCIKVASRG